MPQVVENDEVDEVDEIDETDDSPKKRVPLSDENVYFYDADKLEDAKVSKILRENGSQAPGFRIYTIKKSNGEVCGFANARNDLEALGRFADNKGYISEITFPKERGPGAGPRIDTVFVSLLQKMLDSGQKDMVLEVLKEKEQYKPYLKGL